MTARTSCGACGSRKLDQILDLGSSPLADDFPAASTEPQLRYPLQLLLCLRCWLVQLGEVVDDSLLWSDRYAFRTGASPTAVTYFEAYADWLERLDLLSSKGLVVEIACNDGTLLRHLGRRGAQVLGIEPSGGAAKEAAELGLDVIAAGFSSSVAAGVRSLNGAAMLIVANNVMAHVGDLPDFLSGVRALLAPGGKFVGEVQSVADLILGNQFDHVYHEHRFFFGHESLLRTLRRHGFNLDRIEHTSAQGGSLRFVASPAQPGDGAGWNCEGLARLQPYQGLQARADLLKDRLLRLLTREWAGGRRVVGVAASAKSTTLLNWCGIGPDLVEQVHDLTPGKIGRFTPGTSIPIVADPLPAGRDTSALLLAHNYLSGIVRRESAFLADGGRLVVPIPQPVVI